MQTPTASAALLRRKVMGGREDAGDWVTLRRRGGQCVYLHDCRRGGLTPPTIESCSAKQEMLSPRSPIPVATGLCAVTKFRRVERAGTCPGLPRGLALHAPIWAAAAVAGALQPSRGAK